MQQHPVYGTTERNLNRPQKLQNATTRIVHQASFQTSATALRHQLHWLPIRQRITYTLHWRPLVSRRSRPTVAPHCISTNSFETIRSPEHFDLLPLHCFTDQFCVHCLRLSGVLLLCTSSLELSRDIHKIGEHFQ